MVTPTSAEGETGASHTGLSTNKLGEGVFTSVLHLSATLMYFYFPQTAKLQHVAGKKCVYL